MEAACPWRTERESGEGRRRVEGGRALREWRRTGRALWRSSTMAQREDRARWRWQQWRG